MRKIEITLLTLFYVFVGAWLLAMFIDWRLRRKYNKQNPKH